MLNLERQHLIFGAQIEEALRKVLKHGHFILGPEVQQLEEALCGYSGSRFCISCANGTDALLMALMALNIGAGDFVIVPGFSFVSAPEAVALRGATPLFVDVQQESFNIDPQAVAQTLQWASTRGMSVKAVISVDLFGRPADYASLRSICERFGTTLIADAAQAFGAVSSWGRVGTLADITTTSFFPSKPLGCYGDGGALLTDNEQLAEILVSIRQHGRGSDKYDNVRMGLNSRLDTLQASVLLVKLGRLNEELRNRQLIADTYSTALDGVPGLDIPLIGQDIASSWAQYTLRVDSCLDRLETMRTMAAAGISTAIYYPIPLHLQEAYQHFPRQQGGLPVSESLSDMVLSIPMDPYMTDQEVDRVIVALRKSLGSGRAI